MASLYASARRRYSRYSGTGYFAGRWRQSLGQQLKGWGDSSAERFLGAEVRGRLKAKDKPPPLPDALYLYDFFTSSAMIRASRRLPGLPGLISELPGGEPGRPSPAAGAFPGGGKAPSRPFPAAPRPGERLSRRGAALPLESERFLQLIGRAPSSRPGRAKKVARIPGAACRGAG